MRPSLFALLALLLAGPVGAQEPAPAAPQADVVVTGKRSTAGEVRSFVEALTPVTGGPQAQIGRFETRQFCPAVAGMAPAQAGVAVARMRRVAASAGVPVAKAGCMANVLLIVADDKRQLIEALAKRQAAFFGDLSTRDIRRLAATPGPAVAWQIAGPPLNADGVEIAPAGTGEVAVNQTIASGSRITSASRPHVAAAVVVVEAGALAGLTVTQIADYAVMRALTTADPTTLRGTATPTVLTLLDAPMGAEVPVTLTGWDLGFLTALYRAPNNVAAATQRAAIERGVGREVGEGR